MYDPFLLLLLANSYYSNSSNWLIFVIYIKNLPTVHVILIKSKSVLGIPLINYKQLSFHHSCFVIRIYQHCIIRVVFVEWRVN